MGMPSFTDGPAEESKLTGVGEIRLIPDLSTKRRIPWYKNALEDLFGFLNIKTLLFVLSRFKSPYGVLNKLIWSS